MKTNKDGLKPKHKKYLQKVMGDPVRFASQMIGATLWEREIEILQSIRKNRRTAIKAAHGVGKTFTLALAALWWLARHEQGIVLTTSPTAHQSPDSKDSDSYQSAARQH